MISSCPEGPLFRSSSLRKSVASYGGRLAFRGTGCTFDWWLKIENLYERWVPEPVNEADDMRHIHDFVDSLKREVVAGIDETRKAIDAEPSSGADMAAEQSGSPTLDVA